MKKLITAALALSLLGAASARAQGDPRHDNGPGRAEQERPELGRGAQGGPAPHGPAPQAPRQASPQGPPLARGYQGPGGARPPQGQFGPAQGYPGRGQGAPQAQAPGGDRGGYRGNQGAPQGPARGDYGRGNGFNGPAFNGSGDRGGHEWNAPRRFQGRPYYLPRGFGWRAWAFGEYLPGPFFINDYVIYDPWNYGLPQPPPDFEWLRVGPDALLVRPADGYILDVARGLFD
ncbi:MAG TPA: RcnB family protein [Caulobacteraceae bacterium]|nr:RcnB family protein [Caulobacteraceae bacterium]